MCAAHPRIVLGLHRSRYERRLLRGAADLGIEAIDTSFNYLGFRAHRALHEVAADLLPKFAVSTKVGYFPASGASEHSLSPERLRAAVERTARDLGREPDLIFLHNPEQSLAQASQVPAAERLAVACSVLANAAARGVCGSWGVASWDPRPLAGLAGSSLPRPGVLMVRAGLLVGAETLEAAERLFAEWQPSAVWGMSPFGGNVKAPVWESFDPRIFLCEPQGRTVAQAAFRTAYHLPAVDGVAVGADNLNHLRELTDSLGAEVDDQQIRQYRELLRYRQPG
ncbi:aldo/keto reductase [Streptomyces roseifaciens]